MEEDFIPEFRSLIATMLDNITPRYTPLSQPVRWQLVKAVAIAAAVLLVLYAAFRIFVRLRIRRKDKKRQAQFDLALEEVESILADAGEGSDAGGAGDFVRQCASMGEQIDRHTNRRGNSRLVALLAYRIARETRMNAQQAALCFCCALVADVGMLALPHNLFFREHLTRRERRLFRTQVQHAVSLIGFVPRAYLEFFIGSCLYRRENYDGSGYPDGLAGSAIPVLARIIRAVEDYTAMTEWRLYGHVSPLSPRAAVRDLKKSPGLYDQRIVRIIEKIVL